MLTVRNMCFWY
uniref:Uncharacterized protein n=1 Tax=Arundo donax TaxID=35708 RepID=A0A0A9CPH2_ARUDO